MISSAWGAVITGAWARTAAVSTMPTPPRAPARSRNLAVLRRHLGSLDAVKSIVGVNGYVNAIAGTSRIRRK